MLSVKEISNEKIWESFLKKRKDQNFLQSWPWGEIQESLGNRIFRLGFFESSLQGTALLIKKEARRGSYLACPAGPIINWQSKKAFPFFVQETKKIAQKENIIFIRIRPQILNNPENHNLFKQHGFISAPMHMHAETTWQLDLSKSEGELLKGMSKDHRYEIRKAEKRGVKIAFSKDLKDIELLYEMQLETARRHKFIPFSKELLRAEFEPFLKDDNIILFKAMWRDKPVATAMIIYYGKGGVYHYAATTDDGRKVSAAYAILWEAIREAKKREMRRFNFWGVAPKGRKNHRFSQLNHFKKGFGGFEVDYLHAQDLPIKPTYWLTFAFESLRRKSRKL